MFGKMFPVTNKLFCALAFLLHCSTSFCLALVDFIRPTKYGNKLSPLAFYIIIINNVKIHIDLSLSPCNGNKLNPLTAGVAYIRVFIFAKHTEYHLLNMLKIKCVINQQDLKTIDLHFVKSE